MNARILSMGLALVACTLLLQARTPERPAPVPTPAASQDPLKVRTYKLKNGLTVMISVNKSEPRLQTLIAVRAGSKNDPADHTGLAHYLEHLLFKGTDRYGTIDYAKEKVYLDQIENLYEKYNHTTDAAARKAIYHQIDSVSGIAAQYAIANEYDKMISSIGAKGTNAFTSFEQTVYENDIPSNQLDRWLEIESERFRNPVIRLFHTELETVYEEKNIGMDNEARKVAEATLAALFPHHPYGTQTTIGTVEHLKNPSIKAIKEYIQRYYVPNNMAIILAGDVDPDKAIAAIERTFGKMEPRPVPPFTFTPEQPITAPIEKNVFGPDEESLQMTFRFPGAGTREEHLLELTDLLLAYKTAGFIDLNLKKQQKVQDAGSFPMVLKDYTVHYFTGKPREGQTLEQVRDLLLEQIEHVKKGEFDEATLKAVVRNMAVDQMRGFETNDNRAYTMLHAFTTGIDWNTVANHIQELAKFTKKDVVDFANKAYGNNYVIVYKRKGTDPETPTKIEKPEITPISVNREAQSEFVTNILNENAAEIKPHFIDYSKDISRATLKNDLPLYYLKNSENGTFSMYYVWDMGKNNNKKFPLAIRYLQFLGTDKLTSEQLSRKFFELGLEFEVAPMGDQLRISLSGLSDSFAEGVKILDDLMKNAQPNQQALSMLIASDLKSRANSKLNKQTILWDACRSYAMYGKKNAFTDRIPEADLKNLKAEEIVGIIHSLISYPHKVLYYGPMAKEAVAKVMNQFHQTPKTRTVIPPAVEYPRQKIDEDVIYFVDYDMLQAELIWVGNPTPYDPKNEPMAQIFNEYFGSGMSSVVFQTIRESKALAYATFGAYVTPQRKEDPFYALSYVGTQADKLSEAIPAMDELLQTMPRTDQSFDMARAALRNKLETERINRTDVLFSLLEAEKKGVDHDLRSDLYADLGTVSMDDLLRFHKDRFANHHYAICLLGSKSKLDMDLLRKRAKVVELTLTDIFGY